MLDRFFHNLAQFFSRNIGTKIVSIAVALVLWIVVFGSRKVEITKDVQLEVITSTDIVSSTDFPSHISFRLSGPKAFLRAVLDRRDPPIRVDLSGKRPGLVNYEFFSDNIRLPIGVKVISISPASLLVKLERVKTREIMVRVETRGTPPEGYRVMKTSSDPPKVKIKGAKSRVNALRNIPTTPLDVNGLKQPLQQVASLELDRYGVELDGNLPLVRVEIEAVSANFRIKNVAVEVKSRYRARLKTKSVTVFVRATPEDLADLDESQVFAVIDMSGKKKGKYEEKVEVTVPKNLGLVKVAPETIPVTLY